MNYLAILFRILQHMLPGRQWQLKLSVFIYFGNRCLNNDEVWLTEFGLELNEEKKQEKQTKKVMRKMETQSSAKQHL